MGELIELNAKRAFRSHRDELRDCWQGRLVYHTCRCDFGLVRPKSRMGLIVLSVLAHNFDDALPVLLAAVFPFYIGVGTPMLYSTARVLKTGQVGAHIIKADGRKVRNYVLFRNVIELRDHCRRLAEGLRLSDDEHRAWFDAVNNPRTGWLNCDTRLDPTMDRWDPDAKRLTVQ